MGQEFKLKNGKVLLSTEAPGGIYNSAQLKKIAALCENDGAIVKSTEDQRIALFVSEENVATIVKELKSLGLGIRNYQDGLHQPTACLGEMCPDSEQDALGSAMDMSSDLKSLQISSPLKIGINGCAKCCVPCHTLDVAIVGSTEGYRISLGGKNSQIPEMASFVAEGVPAAELSARVRAVIETYKAQAQEGESFQTMMERVGPGAFVAALAPYSQDASVGVEQDFAIPEATESSEITDVIPVVDEMQDISGEAPVIEVSDLEPGVGADVSLDLTDIELDEIGSLSEQTLKAKDIDVKPLEEEPLDDLLGTSSEAPSVEDAESQFEAQIEESIAEQGKIPTVEDGQADTRLHAIELVETEKLDDVGDMLAQDFATDFSDIDLEDISSSEVEIETAEEDVPVTEIEDAEIEDFDEHELVGDVTEDLPLSEIVGNNVESTSQVIELNRKPKVASVANDSGSVVFSGFNFDRSGDVILSFTNGASLSVSFDSFGASKEQEMNLAGAKVKLVKEEAGIKILVNGMQLFVPRKAS